MGCGESCLVQCYIMLILCFRPTVDLDPSGYRYNISGHTQPISGTESSEVLRTELRWRFSRRVLSFIYTWVTHLSPCSNTSACGLLTFSSLLPQVAHEFRLHSHMISCSSRKIAQREDRMFIQLQGWLFIHRFSVLYSFMQLKRNIGRANRKGVGSNEGNALKEKEPL